MNVRHQVTHA